MWKPKQTGKFYTPQEVFNGLTKSAKKYGHKLISASASEGTIGKEHLMELLDLIEKSDYVYILETNGMNLGNDMEYVRDLAKYKNLHVRVSIKGCNPDEFHVLTGAQKEAYELPFKALENLIEANVSCNACVMSSFSDHSGINRVKEKNNVQ